MSEMKSHLRALADRWAQAKPAERSNAQLYLAELADALGVERPRPSGAGYEFEHPVRVVTRDGTETVKFADLFKDSCFILEAKDEEESASTDILLRRAFGQAVEYAAFVPGGSPPYLLVLDVAKTLIVWDRWHGTYGGFQAGQRIDLPTLAERPDDIDLLCDIWERPTDRDPRARAAAVTKEIAVHLAELATALESRGHDHETVARFLIRTVFTLFAEDVGLLESRPFQALVELSLESPDEFEEGAGELWRAMDTGGRFGVHRLLKYNGHFFRDRTAVPLTREDLAVLMEAARADWADVEPAIFGTLFTRALDPEERHRLGAEFTPPEFVERLVRVTIEEPVRERWTLIQAEVIQLREKGRKKDLKDAVTRLRDFHAELRDIRVLDPACGSGNFLYMALSALKRIELEVIRETEAITGTPELQIEEVDPGQFHGIEIKMWAREIAELTLWIGHHQWWRQTHGRTQPPEPILKDTGTLECRDAVLAYDEVREDPERARPDPTPRIPSPVTGELVPDPERSLPYVEHVAPQPAEWPQADYIVGNPPYMGNKRMREAFGDGYVDALRAAYPDVPESADYVMYWWHRAAGEIAAGRTRRAGLITTNSITQSFNRSVVSTALENGVGIVWAIPSHPWVDEAGSAAVRVAMTVIELEPSTAVRVEVDEEAGILRQMETDRLNADLSAHADVPRAADESLLANEGMSYRGFSLVGRGFVLEKEEAQRLQKLADDDGELVRPYLNGRDLTQHPRGVYVIDFGMRTHSEVREHAVLYDVVRDRVKPQRDANKRKSRRVNWWRFGEPVPTLREALEGLPRFIATPYVSKHRFFVLLDTAVAPDEKIVCVASDEPFLLGVLSSSIHVQWALAAGSRLGVGNDPTYNNSLCFDPFPFPGANQDQRERIGEVMTRLHDHRAAAVERDESVTMTAMYNVVEKLRTGEDLTETERQLHEVAACGSLRDLHDELDEAVAEAYGWPWPLGDGEILSRLVALHDERKGEEAAGVVQWLRPDYQVPRFGADLPQQTEIQPTAEPTEDEVTTGLPFPSSAIDQITAIKDSVAEAPGDVEEVASRFKGARRTLVERHLETLRLLAEVHQTQDDRYHPTGASVETI